MVPDIMGKMVDVEITSATKFSLISQPVSEPQRPDVPQALEKGQVSGLSQSLPTPRVADGSIITRWWPLVAFTGLAGLRLAWIIWRRR